MELREEFAAERTRWTTLTFYQKFERTIALILTGLLAVVITSAVWNLALKIILGAVLANSLDPTDNAVFQAIFGMIFTVIIALEFKRSILLVAERQESIVQVQTVILIALLAVVRKLMILDLATTDPLELLALAASILALGVVHWLVRS
jgi:uncharacterized membrane protein (DUF373 family)